MDQPDYQLTVKWWKKTGTIILVYRLFALAVAVGQIQFLGLVQEPVVSVLVLLAGGIIYTLLIAPYPFIWDRLGFLNYPILGFDLVICLALVLLSGGLDSPFLLYTLAPALTSALHLSRKVTFALAALTLTGVVCSELPGSPGSSALALNDLSFLLLYLVALSSISFLPYLTNINLRQRRQSEIILRERQRLSREIHDEIGQTVAALRWQAEYVQRQLKNRGFDLPEVRELVKLTARAHQDTRECMALLRSYNGDGSFVYHLRDYVDYLRKKNPVNFYLCLENDQLRLGPLVDLQLLRICQEAMVNAIRHSGARNIRVNIHPENGRLAVSIVDDGRGFDAASSDRRPKNEVGQGLAVMQERAEDIGGRLKIMSLPGRGTEVRIEVPLTTGRRISWQNR